MGMTPYDGGVMVLPLALAAERSLRLRTATKSDAAALKRLEDEVFVSDRLSKRSIRHALASATQEVLLLQDAAGAIVGSAFVHYRAGATLCRIYSIAVGKHWRAVGCGGWLLAACENTAVRRRCTAVGLEVRTDNLPAMGFYERSGYVQTGRKRSFYEDGADAFRYVKRGLGLGAPALHRGIKLKPQLKKPVSLRASSAQIPRGQKPSGACADGRCF
jgi:[ribosomal protein S18]-alanine N-acetyltransferase